MLHVMKVFVMILVSSMTSSQICYASGVFAVAKIKDHVAVSANDNGAVVGARLGSRTRYFLFGSSVSTKKTDGTLKFLLPGTNSQISVTPSVGFGIRF